MKRVSVVTLLFFIALISAASESSSSTTLNNPQNKSLTININLKEKSMRPKSNYENLNEGLEDSDGDDLHHFVAKPKSNGFIIRLVKKLPSLPKSFSPNLLLNHFRKFISRSSGHNSPLEEMNDQPLEISTGVKKPQLGLLRKPSFITETTNLKEEESSGNSDPIDVNGLSNAESLMEE